MFLEIAGKDGVCDRPRDIPEVSERAGRYCSTVCLSEPFVFLTNIGTAVVANLFPPWCLRLENWPIPLSLVAVADFGGVDHEREPGTRGQFPLGDRCFNSIFEVQKVVFEVEPVLEGEQWTLESKAIPLFAKGSEVRV
jgi:hypothetical protein